MEYFGLAVLVLLVLLVVVVAMVGKLAYDMIAA